MPLHSERVLRVQQGLNATEQVSYAIAFWHDCRYTEHLGERLAEKVLVHSEDDDGCFWRADVKPRGDFYSVRNRHAQVQNYKIRLEVLSFMNCFIAVSGFTDLKCGAAFNEGPHGVSDGSLVLGNENSLGHG